MWFANFFIDIANAIIGFIPLVCYLGGVALGIASVVYFSHLGNASKEASSDKPNAILCFLTASVLLSFGTYFDAWNVSFGMTTTGSVNGQLYTAQTTLPSVTAQTPQAWFTSQIAIFMPFFEAWGALAILRAVFLLRDAYRQGHGVAWSFFGFSIAGVLLANLDTIAQQILADAGT